MEVLARQTCLEARFVFTQKRNTDSEFVQCIAKWLDPKGAAKNHCPVCRYVLFQTQPETLVEANARKFGIAARLTIRTMCETYCSRLDLAHVPSVIDVSERLAWNIYIFRPFDYRSMSTLSAFAVSAASFMLRTPRILSRITMVTGEDQHEILRLCRSFCRQEHRYLLDEESLMIIGRDDVTTILCEFEVFLYLEFRLQSVGS